ncbi:MAG: DUF452 family protein [Bacteroides sp.]|nr:DUF452 family protein [Bacteroides sp.]
MKTQTVTRLSHRSEPRLILFFAGWGMDARPFATLGREGYDTAVVWDYADPTPIPADFLDAYREICVVGWSFGVPYAARFIAAEEKRRPITRCVAVNGTLNPVDDSHGIPRAIFEGTLNGLTERTLDKFNRRMAGSAEAAKAFAATAPRRSIADLTEELKRVDADGEAPRVAFDSVYISGADRIIPPRNQRNAWEGLAPITDLGPEGPHLPDFAFILSRETADKSRIGSSFESAGATYDSEAAIQHEVAQHLAELWHSGTPLPHGDIIEFGTGTGQLTRILAADRPMRLYDIAPVSAAVKRADAEIMIGQMIAERPTAGVIAASTIQWFNSPRRFIGRALRAMPPGSRLALSTFGPDTYRELAPFQQSRPAYMSADELREIASALAAEGVAEPDFTVEAGPVRVMEFGTTRRLAEHIRLSGVNATRLNGTAAARALLAAAPTKLTYAPVYIMLRRRR